MGKTSLSRKPEYWLLVFALIGVLLGAAATYAGRLVPGTSGPSGIQSPPLAAGGNEASWRIQDEQNTVQVFEATKRGVVLVATSRGSRAAAGKPGTSRKGNGSGFFIDAQGHVVTNNHVIEDAVAIEVQTFSGKTYKATVVGSDRLTDLAILKVQSVPREEVFPLTLADYREVRVGQKAIVLGSPLAAGSSMGLDRSPTVTTGIISAKDRSMPIESLTKPNVNDYTIENLVQTDAAVNPGNSGGPLLSSRGEVIGVVTAIMDSASGIGFAIPSQVVADIVPQILKSGEVKRAFMGIAFMPLDSLSRAMDASSFAEIGLGVQKGALVTDVESGGPAQKAGLRGASGRATVGGQEFRIGGDVIVSIDDVEVTGSNLSSEILKHRPGDKVRLGVLRSGKRMTVEVTLGSR